MSTQTSAESTIAGKKKEHDSDDLREQLGTLKADFADLSKKFSGEAKQQISEIQDRAADNLESLEEQIRSKPLTSAAIAAGVGFLVGAILSR